MRTYWLGVVALLFTAGCTHDGQLRPQAGAIPLTEEGTAAVIGEQGVMLVAYGSNWQGQPRNLEQRFTPVEIRLENHSGRTLAIRYDGFELEGRKHQVARDPNELGHLLAAQDPQYRPPRNISGPRLRPRQTYQDSKISSTPRDRNDTTYSPYNGTSPYTPPPCLTCATRDERAELPSPDMLRLALAEGPLEDGQVRQGFLYFEQLPQRDAQVTLKVKLVDAATGESFGMLSVPFESIEPGAQGASTAEGTPIISVAERCLPSRMPCPVPRF